MLLWKSPHQWRTDKLYVSGQLDPDYCQHVGIFYFATHILFAGLSHYPPNVHLTFAVACLGRVCGRRQDIVQRRICSHPTLAIPRACEDSEVTALLPPPLSLAFAPLTHVFEPASAWECFTFRPLPGPTSSPNRRGSLPPPLASLTPPVAHACPGTWCSKRKRPLKSPCTE